MAEPKNLYHLSISYLHPEGSVPRVTYYDPTKDEFICIAAAACLALDMLWSETGQRSLARNGREIVTEYYRKSGELIPSDDTISTQVNESVKAFLGYILNQFPSVVLRDLGWSRGRTTKETWGQDGTQYNPKDAAIIEIDIKFTSRLVKALCMYREARREGGDVTSHLLSFQVIMLRLAITIAHELVHCFTGYLLKKHELHTPPTVAYGYGSYKNTGESGRKWEHRMFGGYIEVRERGETVQLAAIKEFGDKVFIADPAVVQAILDRDFRDLPFEDGDSSTRMEAYLWGRLDTIVQVDEKNQDCPRLSSEVITDTKLYYGFRYTVYRESFRNFHLYPDTPPSAVGNRPLSHDQQPLITLTFQNMCVDDLVENNSVSTYGITFHTECQITLDPYSPLLNVLSAAQCVSSDGDGPIWRIGGSLRDGNHSRFGITVNAPVKIAIRRTGETKWTEEHIALQKLAGPYSYIEFATGKANIEGFMIQHKAPFSVAALSTDNTEPEIYHRPDFQLMFTALHIPDNVGKTGSITLKVALLYDFAEIIPLSVSSTPPGLFEDTGAVVFQQADGGVIELPLTARAQINDGDIVSVTGGGLSGVERTIGFVYRRET